MVADAFGESMKVAMSPFVAFFSQHRDEWAVNGAPHGAGGDVNPGEFDAGRACRVSRRRFRG
jgi:hypothetical protein